MKISLVEIQMLQDAIREWEAGVCEQEDEDEGSSAYSKKELNAMQSVKEKLIDLEKKRRGNS